MELEGRGVRSAAQINHENYSGSEQTEEPKPRDSLAKGPEDHAEQLLVRRVAAYCFVPSAPGVVKLLGPAVPAVRAPCPRLRMPVAVLS